MGVTSFVPDEVKHRVFDTLVELLRSQAEKALGEEAAHVIGRLHSEAEFRDSFDQAMERAVARFADEYDDKAVASAVASNSRFWKSPALLEALEKTVTRPSSYLLEERETIERGFFELLPKYSAERVGRAMSFFFRCVSDEVTSIPVLQPLYMVQLQKASLEQARKMVSALDRLQADQRETLKALIEHAGARMPLPSGSDDDMGGVPRRDGPPVHKVEARRRSMPTDTAGYNTAAIRELLIDAFTRDDFHLFCKDRPRFKWVVSLFGPEESLAKMVDHMIDFCDTRGIFPELLSEVQAVRSSKFELHQRAIGGSPLRGLLYCYATLAPRDFDDKAANVYRHVLAGFVGIARIHVWILGTETSSLMVKVELPAWAARRLLDAFESGDAHLMARLRALLVTHIQPPPPIGRAGASSSLVPARTALEATQALLQLQDTREACRKEGDREGEALAVHDIGTTWYDLGRYDLASQSHKEELTLIPAENKRSRGHCYLSLAWSLAGEEEEADAVEAASRAVENLEAAGDPLVGYAQLVRSDLQEYARSKRPYLDHETVWRMKSAADRMMEEQSLRWSPQPPGIGEIPNPKDDFEKDMKQRLGPPDFDSQLKGRP